MSSQGALSERRPTVFLSSVYKDQVDGVAVPLPLRRAIMEAADPGQVQLEAIEEPVQLAEETPAELADSVMDRCFAAVRACDLFVLLLSQRPGSGVSYVPEGTAATYTEMEVFAACLWGKPILVLHESGLEASPILLDMLRVLRVSLREDYVVDTLPGLVRSFRNKCDELATGGQRSKATVALPDGLSRLRSDQSAARDLELPQLMFLNGRLGPVASRPNPDRAAALIRQVQLAELPRDNHAVPMSHGAAMFRLWAAMRDLMGESPTPWKAPEYSGLWDEALGLWASRASWVGLHGHIWLSPLAALNLQIAVRARGTAVREGAVREPHGARASAIYSLAGVMGSRERKVHFYEQALLAAEAALHNDTRAIGGVLAIKGHVLMRLATLGRYPDIFRAVAALEQSLALRIKAGASEANIGEAQADLGFAYVLALQPWRGLPLLREGVAGLRKDPSPIGLSFLARGLKKLEQASLITGNLAVSREARGEARRISISVEAFDQWRR